MKALRKVFGGIQMTWPKVIAFAVITSVITAAFLLLPVFRDSPLREMGVGFEWWFVFAIFIICNCRTALDAGGKTFVFFLISQPLIYLLQQPFSEINLLQTYYFRWLVLTVLTFPGGIIAFYIKKDKIYSALILAVAGAFLGLSEAMVLMNNAVKGNVSYVIYGLFFLIVAILLGVIILRKKTVRAVYLTIVGIAILAGIGYSLLIGQYEVTDYPISEEGTWQIDSVDLADGTATIEDGQTIRFKYRTDTSGEVICSNEEHEQLRITVVIGEETCDISEDPISP